MGDGVTIASSAGMGVSYAVGAPATGVGVRSPLGNGPVFPDVRGHRLISPA